VLFADEEGEWGRGDEAVIVSPGSCFRVVYHLPGEIRYSVHHRREKDTRCQTKSEPAQIKK
jgi:hypothetical protein